MFSNHPSTRLIVDLDNSLRDLLRTPEKSRVEHCFSLIRHIHQMKSTDDDQLYIPILLILREFHRFNEPSLFDKLLEEMTLTFRKIPLKTRKIVDELLTVISLILSKRISTTNDEVQKQIFVRFVREFIENLKKDEHLFYVEFLGDLNRNLPIVGHLLSGLLKIFDENNSLDDRLEMLDCLWRFFYVENLQHENLIGLILSSFLPGLLKSLVQNLGFVHQRLIESDLSLISYIVRLTIRRTKFVFKEPIKNEIRDLIVEPTETWLETVDAHLEPLLKRLSNDYVDHQSLSVRRSLAFLMIHVVCFAPETFRFSNKTSMKTIFLIYSRNDDEILRRLLEQLFSCSPTNLDETSIDRSDLSNYENIFLRQVFQSNEIRPSEHLLADCQNELFRLIEQQNLEQTSPTENQRRHNLQYFLGFYTFIRGQIDFLFQMESFIEKFVDFLEKNFDLHRILVEKSFLLNEKSPKTSVDTNIFKYFQSDVDDELRRLIRIFRRSNENLRPFLSERIRNLDEKTTKAIYFLSIIYEDQRSIDDDDLPVLLNFFNGLIADDEKRTTTKRRKKNKKSSRNLISLRNLTIDYLLRCFAFAKNQIDLIGSILLSHSSLFTVVHQSSLFCLEKLSTSIGIENFLQANADYIVDISLRKCQTSFYDGYLILIEFVRLGRDKVINLPMMTFVIEQFLLDLASLPTNETIRLIFEFFDVFCRQVVDIVNHRRKPKKTIVDKKNLDFIEFAVELMNERQIAVETKTTDEDENDVEEKHSWHQMLVSIVDVFQHFISNSNVEVRSSVLNSFPSLAQVLSDIDENLFLPLVHKIWPGLVQRFYDPDINIRMRCLSTIQCLCELCCDFVDRRIRQDIFPILVHQLEKNRSLTSINCQEYRYMKYLFTHLASIINTITISFEQIEHIVILLLQYLQNPTFDSMAHRQLIILAEKYADLIWLRLILHDQNENFDSYFKEMKVYRAQPRLIIDTKWKSSLITRLTRS